MEVQDATLTVDLKAPAIPEAPTTGNANCAAVHGSVEQVRHPIGKRGKFCKAGADVSLKRQRGADRD